MTRRFTTEITVQWGDVDLAGVVYFPHFFRYVDIAEAEFYNSLGPTVLELEESLGIRLPRVEATCRFLKPARFGDRLSVTLEIERLSTKTVRYLFGVRRGNEAIAEGHLVIASVSIADFKAIPLPQKLRELLRPYAPPDGGA
jgi:acyl-CoA thioester hydrolase